MADYESLLKEYRKLAKRADQRLVRLESYKHDKGFKTAIKWSYAKALRDIKSWSGSDAKRFNTKPPESVAGLKAKIQDIKNFLESPTSTKKGIMNVYKKKADTINKRYGTNFTWENLANYYMSGMAEKLDAEYGSKTALKSIAEIQKHDKEEIQAIQKTSESHLQIEDKIVKATVNKILEDEGLNLALLFM